MLLLKFYSIYIYASELQLITTEIESVLTLQKESQKKEVLDVDSNTLINN